MNAGRSMMKGDHDYMSAEVGPGPQLKYIYYPHTDKHYPRRTGHYGDFRVTYEAVPDLA